MGGARMQWARIALVIVALVAAAPDARADPFSEIRIGVLAHDQAPVIKDKEEGTDFNAELLFASPSFLDAIGSPRPYVGFTAASEGTSHIHAGLGWEGNLAERWFLYGNLGLAAHDGDPLLEEDQTPDEQMAEKALGCRVNFHLAVGAGYRLSRRWNLAIHYEHLSNATLCESNGGIENIGVRLGYAF
jgi:hypothetical protein